MPYALWYLYQFHLVIYIDNYLSRCLFSFFHAIIYLLSYCLPILDHIFLDRSTFTRLSFLVIRSRIILFSSFRITAKHYLYNPLRMYSMTLIFPKARLFPKLYSSYFDLLSLIFASHLNSLQSSSHCCNQIIL